MTKKLKDITKMGSLAQVRSHFEKIRNRLDGSEAWVAEHVERDAQRVLCSNLIKATAEYLVVARSSLESHISVSALATRNIYEINLQLRALLEIEGRQDAWQSEAVLDKRQMLEGIMALSQNENSKLSNETHILQSEVLRLTELIVKYNLPSISSHTQPAKLAKKLGMESEHASMFKFYSKLVHPTSYLVNDFNDASANEHRVALQIHAQLYALDSLNRYGEFFDVPEKLRSA